MLVHRYSGVRPSTTICTSRKAARASDDAGEVDTKLRYGDFTMLLKKDDRGVVRIGVRTHFTYFKGEKRRAQRLVLPTLLYPRYPIL
jgi:hypothetical protein